MKLLRKNKFRNPKSVIILFISLQKRLNLILSLDFMRGK